MADVKVTNIPREKEGVLPPASLSWPVLRSNLFTINPFALMKQFTDEMDRLYHAAVPGDPLHTWMPVVEVKKVNGNVMVTAELPGLHKEDVKVEVSGENLIIEGERREEKKRKKKASSSIALSAATATFIAPSRFPKARTWITLQRNSGADC